jgi:dolichol kinase
VCGFSTTASFAVTLVFTLIFNTRYGSFLPAVGVSTIVAAAATFVELFTPLGIDNLTVPLAVAAVYEGVFV